MGRVRALSHFSDLEKLLWYPNSCLQSLLNITYNFNFEARFLLCVSILTAWVFLSLISRVLQVRLLWWRWEFSQCFVIPYSVMPCHCRHQQVSISWKESLVWGGMTLNLSHKFIGNSFQYSTYYIVTNSYFFGMSHCITLSPYTIYICLCIRKFDSTVPSLQFLSAHTPFLWAIMALPIPGMASSRHGIQEPQSPGCYIQSMWGCRTNCIFIHCCLPLRSDCSQTSFCDWHYGNCPIR